MKIIMNSEVKLDNCIFCKIIKKEIESKFEYFGDDMIAINDINPKAKVHILIIPKKHIISVATLEESDDILMGKMIMIAKKLAEEKNIAKTGYRLIFNVGTHAGQVVDHIHLHLLGGGPLN